MPNPRALAFLLFVLVASAQEEPEPPLFAISGRVVDPEGAPRAGAFLRLWDAFAADRYLGDAVTDKRGAFRIPVETDAGARREHRFGTVVLVVSGKGIAQRRLEIPAGEEDLVVVAAAPEPRTGVVRDGDRNPIPGAIVRARGGDIEETTTGDERGVFRLVRLAPGPLELRVEAPGYAVRRVRLAAAEGDVVLARLRLVSGLVVDSRGNGVGGVPLYRDGAGPPTLAAITDDEGRYSLWDEERDGPPPVVVHAPGFVVAALAAERTALQPAAPVRGRLLDEKDEPVGGAKIELRAPDRPPLVTRTDVTGRFFFSVVPARFARLTAHVRGAPPVVREIDPTLQPGPHELRVVEGFSCRGRVVRAGVGALGVRVSFLAEGVGGGIVPARGREVAFVFTDARGHFAAAAVSPSANRVVAWEAGRRCTETPVRPELELALVEKLTVAGGVVSDAGVALTGAEVVIGETRVAVAGDGSFRVAGLPPGRHRLRATAARHAPFERDVWAGDRVELVLESRLGAGTLDVAVAATGLGRARIAIARREAPRVVREAVVPLGEAAAFAGLPAGTYDVIVRAAGYLEAVAEAAVTDAGARVELRPSRPGTLHVVGTRGARVAVQTLEGAPAPEVAFALDEGRRTFVGFGPGRYRFMAHAPGELVVVHEIEFRADSAPATADLRGGAESTLVVRVTDDEDRPVSGATVRFVSAGGFVWPGTLRTDAEGRARRSRLVAGRARIEASFGDQRGAARLDVEPGRALEATVVIR